jgi:hypothetical protein
MFILSNNVFDEAILFPLQSLQGYLHHSLAGFQFQIFELLGGDRSLDVVRREGLLQVGL